MTGARITAAPAGTANRTGRDGALRDFGPLVSAFALAHLATSEGHRSPGRRA